MPRSSTDMKNKTLLIALTLTSLIAASAFAGAPTWKEKCPDWKTCIENYSALTGEQYLYANLVAQMNFTDNLPFEKEDADLIFSNILYQNGLARVPVKPNVYEILRQNDAKSKNLLHFDCDQRNAPKLPDTYDLVIMEYQFANPVMVKEAENAVRSYSDMGSRIYGFEANGRLIIVESAKNLNKIYKLLVSFDVKPTAEYLAKMKAREAAWLKAKAENKDDRGAEHGKSAAKKDDKKP